jgi:hypothetical protein
MSGPAVPFRGYAAGTEPITLTPGVDGFAALIPYAEPLSAGEPPLTPDLIANVRRSDMVKYLPDRAGYVKTGMQNTVGRLTGSCTWTHQTYEQRELLREWFRSTIKDGQLAFDLRIDGPDEEAIKVKARQNSIVDTQLSRVGGMVYTMTLEWEEVF